MSDSDMQVPDGWKKRKLGDVANIFFSNVDKKSYPEEKSVRLCNYMDVYKNGYITNEIHFMEATATQREIEKYKLLRNDVLITKDSETPDDIAIPALVSDDLENVLCGYHLAMIRPHNELCGGYLAHFFGLDSVRHYYYTLASGSTRFGLTTDVITFSTVPLPPLPEQKKIASILTSVDSVIEKTEAQISKLQDLKKGMMTELLIKGIGHTEFKDSPVGKIPESWDVINIGKLGQIVTGNTPKTNDPENYGGDIQFISPADMGETVFVKKTKSHITNKGFSSTRKIPQDSVLIVCIGSTIGKTGITSTECSTNQQINTIICQENDYLFTYYLMTQYSKNIKSMAGTQAVPIINKTEFSSILVQLPSILEQKKIASILSSIDTRIESKQQKLSQTKSLKKALMNDLLTGKKRVR